MLLPSVFAEADKIKMEFFKDSFCEKQMRMKLLQKPRRILIGSTQDLGEYFSRNGM